MSDSSSQAAPQGELFGHPCGLFTLFFAEMWERFSYYGMRALLTLYMIKGFLGYGDGQAFAVYGAYTALVYATPFIGGMIADRLLGARKAVVLGGILMSAGHLVMMVNQSVFFFAALALLIVGNGFFKPNISTIVGGLYKPGDDRRDRGFTIFYMGINLGAALAPLLCGYVGEKFGWHYGFGLATIGMLIGLAVFWAPKGIAQALILGGAILTSASMIWLQLDNHWALLILYVLVAIALVISGVVAFVALGRGGIPDDAGQPKDPEAAKRKVFGLIRADMAVYLGVAISIPIFSLLVQRNELAGAILGVFGAAAFAYLIFYAIKAEKVARERLFVVLILMFFSLLFWAFFEQAGSSVNLFTDRNVDRVLEERVVTDDEVGKTITFRTTQSKEDAGDMGDKPMLSQEQLGLKNTDPSMNALAATAYVQVKDKTVEEKAERVRKVDGALYTKLKKIADDEYVVKELAAALVRDAVRFEALKKELPAAIKAPGDLVEKNEALALSLGDFIDGKAGKPRRSQPRSGSEKKVLKAQLKKLTTAETAALLKEFESALPKLGADFLDRAKALVKPGAALDATIKSLNDDEKDVLFAKLSNFVAGWKSNEKTGNSLKTTDYFSMTALTALRDASKHEDLKDDAAKSVNWNITKGNVGMGVGGTEIPASVFQAINPIYIILFGLVFTWLWSFLGSKGMEPSTPFKFALGLLQLGLGFGAFWYGAHTADGRGMSSMSWIFLGYLLQTTGELCLSPVGLSMVTRLSPKVIVSTVMGAWFLATAFSNFLASMIATLTGVSHGGDGGAQVLPAPTDTVNTYGDVFGKIAIAAMISAGICFLLVPVLKRWMHEDEEQN